MQEVQPVGNKTKMEHSQTNLKQFCDLHQEVIHFYNDHDIDSAHDLIKILQTQQQQIKHEKHINSQEFQVRIKQAQQQMRKQGKQLVPFNRQVIVKITKQYQNMIYNYNLATQVPFIQKYNKDGIKISSRKDDKNIGILIQTQLHSPFQNIITLFNDTQYLPGFLPFCQKSTLIKNVSRNSKVGHAILSFPIISKRQIFFQGFAFNRTNYNKQIILYAFSIHDKPQVQKQLGIQIQVNKNYVPLGYRYFLVRYQPLSQGVGNLKFAANFDYGINFIPAVAQDLIIREFGKKLFNNMLSIGSNFKGSKWQANVQKDPGVFTFVQQKVKEYLQRKPKEKEQQPISQANEM